MKAFLMDYGGDKSGQGASRVYIVFGEDAVAAGDILGEKLNIDPEKISVGGSWEVNPNEPIDVSSFWPYFTSQPSTRHISS